MIQMGKKVLEAIHNDVPGKRTLSKEMGGLDLFLKLEDMDRYSVVFSELGLNYPKLESVQFEDLEKQIRNLENRLTYLPEKLTCLELDRKDLSALLRSEKPEKKQESFHFYELKLVKGRKISLYRIENKQGHHKKIAIVLSQDIFSRLLDDLSDVLMGKLA